MATAEAAREIHNPRTGQRMRFLLTAAETGGELLRIETVNPGGGGFEPLHVHPFQESGARVTAGALRFVVDGRERVLRPGDEIRIPAGVPHHFAAEGGEDAVAIQELRPALRTEEFFRWYFGMAQRGELDDRGRPSLLRSAVLGLAFEREIRLVHPPWPLQRALYAALRPLARLRGHPEPARPRWAGASSRPDPR